MKNKILERYEKEGLVVPGVFDKVFKSVMQDENCKDYLIEIINNLTNIPKEYLKENIIFKNSELPIEYLNEKQKITDLVIEVQNNIINLEMNNFYYKGLIEINDMYLNELRKIKLGEEYVNIPKVIQINFDNFNKFTGKTVRKFMILDVENYEKETQNYEKYHINLKLIKKKYYNKEKLTKLEKMLLLLVLDKKSELREVTGEDDIMKRVEEKITKLSRDSAMILCYDEEEYRQKAMKASIMTELEEAKEKLQKEQEKLQKEQEKLQKKQEKIEKEAKEQGIKEGIEEGKKEGIKEGIRKNQKEIVINMLNKNMDKNLIMELAGLSEKEMEEIIKEYK